MKKKIFGILVSIALMATLLSFLAACGEKTAPDDVNVSEKQQETANSQATQSNVASATIEETVMWDNNDIKITALSLSSDQNYHILNLRIENKTGKDLHVLASRTAVNTFVVEPIMGVNVPANSTEDGELKFYRDDVPAGVIADIETRFSYSSSDYSVNTKTERVKLKSSAADSYDYSYDESGTVLHDADGIKIICKGFNDAGNPIVYLSSTGELSEGCCVEVAEIFVNGSKTYSDYCEWVFTNTRNIAELELSDEDLDGNKLGKIENLKVSFKINKEHMADTSPVRTEPVEIPVK